MLDEDTGDFWPSSRKEYDGTIDDFVNLYLNNTTDQLIRFEKEVRQSISCGRIQQLT